MSDDMLNPFIPESEKEFFTGYTDTNWNTLARTAITTKGRRDLPEASRAIELIQPALASGFEAAKAILALTTKELKRTHHYEPIGLGERERLLRRWNVQGGAREPEEAGREHQLFSSRGRCNRIRCISRLHNRFRTRNGQKWTPEKIQFGKENQRICLQTAPEKGIRQELHRFQVKEENVPVSCTVRPNHHWKASPYSWTISTSYPKDSRRDSYGINGWSQQMVAREERAAPCRETERGERGEREEREEREENYSEMNIQRETVAPDEKRSETEMQKQHVNIRETLSSSDQRKERERETTGDSVREISIEDVRHETTRTEGDSEYPRVTGQKSESENGKIVWRTSGTVIESPIWSALEVSLKIAIADTHEEEGNTQMQSGHKTPGVRESIAIGQPKEPLPGRLVNRLSEWKKIGGDKLTRVSGDDGDDEQLFIPLGGGIEERSGEAHTGVGGEVVQPDVHGDKEERKVEKDPGLQNSKRRSAVKTFQDGFPGDSCGTPGGERFEDHSGHIECISTCKGKRTIQSLHGCIEIDLTGDSPVPEKSGLDTVGREAEVGTHKECGVSRMALEFREDGSDTPGKEECAAPGRCANLDSTCKEKEETKDEGSGSAPREVEFCEVTTPTSELADDVYAIRAEVEYSSRGLEGNNDSQPNDTGRINTLEKDPSRKQTEVSEEENKASISHNGCFRIGLGGSVNNSGKEQRGEDICPRELDPPGECVSDKRKGVQSSVEDFRKERSMAATTEDRPYSSEDRQYVHEMDNTEEDVSAIAHSNTESIGEETEQPGHFNTDGTSPGREEHGSRCTQPDGEKAGLCTEGGEGRRDITNNRTENTRYNCRTDCAGALRKYLETILSEREERERNARKRDGVSPPVPEKHCTCAEREDERSPEGSDDSDSTSLAGADLDPATAAWAIDNESGDLSGVHDTGSEDEEGRLEITPRRGYKRYTGEENIQERDLFLTWGEYVGAKEIAAAILRN
ncbi:uncharacterized protein MONOS_8621 [Monocercomonoides exilis]|uniref:uncharacterized protein n=1 Tax=Monocercomonoides exilis TaxID=2049356 RepID=UPI00355A0595|nr:hypothetical protein MONOS_8621 [Monocercomonoides exilis]|eukprot:MONOS_8621.1-p1 / transcript=MONOS_8621.1 / gene=MONOS_8621 / organism=Monocercomonoides_exilis_PA203 / gene_product=unspecified product / transcript_product=unspecified product / location=Mono_scaffold00329:35121-38382(-) / protein_length=976 / sequence_SO=supercontig / SO=protein_coding / is_pseudo=false